MERGSDRLSSLNLTLQYYQEPLFPSSWYYLRALIGLTFIGLLLELRFAYNLLQSTSAVAGVSTFASIQPDFGSNSMVRARKIVLHRGMGTCTIMTSALIFVYRVTFPYMKLEVLPVVSVPCYPFLSYLLCVVVLLVLSWRFHPLTSVLAGSMSALAWVLGLTNFLSRPYWGGCLAFWVISLSLLSLKHSWNIPCIDYVAWDEQGVIREVGVDTDVTTMENREDDDGDDDDSMVDLENPRPRRSLRGQLPSWTALGVDEERDEPMPRSGNFAAALTRRHQSPLRL